MDTKRLIVKSQDSKATRILSELLLDIKKGKIYKEDRYGRRSTGSNNG